MQSKRFKDFLQRNLGPVESGGNVEDMQIGLE